MKYYKIIACVFAFLVATTMNAQSVYQLQYRFNQSVDTVSYRVFFINYEDGTRVGSYQIPCSDYR
jgi:hypothetical protein